MKMKKKREKMKMKISENNEMKISSVNCNIEIKFNKQKNLYKNFKKKKPTHTQKKPTFITQINGTLNNFK